MNRFPVRRGFLLIALIVGVSLMAAELRRLRETLDENASVSGDDNCAALLPQ